MLTTEDFKQYKNQSFILQLKKIAHSTEVNPFNYRYLFFGGTGAVGGQVVIELLESYVFMQNISSQNISDKPQFFITGIDHFQIEQFCQKLYAIFGESNFKKVEATDESLEIHFKDFIELHFYVLMAQPKFEIDLDKEIVNYSSDEDKIQFLMSEASKITAPFKDFVLKLQKITKNSEPFRAVVSGIPIPSVATYHFESIDLLLAKHNLVNDEEDKTLERKIKSEILKGLAKDFGLIKERLSEEVLIAHTTSVGGMYQYIDDLAVIKTGYAHSSLGKLLREKQFYAFMLTNYYSEFNLKSLITSAAIGIDYIYKTSTLPLSSGISRLYRVANQNATIPFDLKALKDQHSQKLVNAIFKPKSINTSNLTSEDGNFEIGRQMIVNYALRSGENGIFSLDNAYALYLNMKIASQEELAHVLTYNALFGDDEQKPWFDQHGICYYTQTDNSSLIFSFLNNRSEFRNYQTGTFTVKAFQELGSSKHQSELHTWGLFILLHRISQLKNVINDDDLPTGLEGIKSFIDKKTSKLTLQNVARFENNYNNLANQFYQLLTVKTVEDMAAFAKIDDSLNQNQKNFLNGVLTLVQETTHSITSLGTPILIADANGNEEILAGPYFAPLDLLLIKSNSLSDRIQQLSTQSGNSQKDLFNWIICNNGVVDLRPLAVFNRAADYNGSLKNDIKIIDNFNTFRAECNALKKENGNNLKEHIPFTSSGLIAYIGRIIGLLEMLEEYDLSLGTYNGWKTLFTENDEGDFILVPGIVEAMRHYTEGLGKITGTEFLYPRYGYFKK